MIDYHCMQAEPPAQAAALMRPEAQYIGTSAQLCMPGCVCFLLASPLPPPTHKPQNLIPNQHETNVGSQVRGLILEKTEAGTRP